MAELSAQDLITLYGYWGNHPQFPLADWKYEVACGDTRTGYWDWIAAQLSEGRD